MKRRKRSAVTKAKMLQGIQDILMNDGSGKVNVAYVSTYSGIDRKLLYYHFGSFSKMVAEFLQLEQVQFKKNGVDPQDKEAMSKYLLQRFNNLFDNPILSQLLVWELLENSTALQQYARLREQDENEFLKKVEDKKPGKDNEIDKKALFAILLGGVHYLSAYFRQNQKPFMGINLHDESAREHFLTVLSKLLNDLT